MSIYAYVYEGEILGLTDDPENIPRGWKCYKCPTTSYNGREYEMTQASQVYLEKSTESIRIKPAVPTDGKVYRWIDEQWEPV